MAKTTVNEPFLTDVKTLRERARKSIAKGAVTQNYGGDVKQTIDILQAVLATEIVCVLRYTMHAVSATGISSDSVKEEFAQHAKEEQGHMMAVAERINQLGGKPNFDPEGLSQPLRIAICRRRRPDRHDQGKSDCRAHCRRALSRADPLLWRQRYHHASHAGTNPWQRRRACQRYA